MRLERFRFRAMGSPCEFQLWSESRDDAASIARACAHEIERLELKFSRYRDDSLVTRINESAGDSVGVEVDQVEIKIALAGQRNGAANGAVGHAGPARR